MPRVLIAGCGFLGTAAARLFHDAGWTVTGLTHAEESARALSEQPFEAVACDISDRAAITAGLRADVIIDCVSSGRGGAAEYQRVYFDGASNLLDLLSPARFIFVSSTSVYAQTDGEWVTEESSAEPSRETGQILRATEDLVLARGGMVARLSGIYGPGRSVLLRKFLAGEAVIEGDGSRWINQIHRADAAHALLALVEKNAPAGIYNVSDDSPIQQRDCFSWLVQHFRKPLPPSGPIDPNRKRGWTNKRVCNAKLRTLGWSPAFPSFRDAVAVGLVS